MAGLFDTVLSGLTGALGKRQAAPQVTVTHSFIPSGYSGIPQWTEDNYFDYAKRGYGQLSAFYACVNALITSANSATLEIRQYTGRDNAGVEDFNLDFSSPLSNLIQRPNSRMEPFEFVEWINLFLQVTGNAYIFKGRLRSGQIVALDILPSHRVRIVPVNGVVGGYIYTNDVGEWYIAPEHVGHIKLPNPFDDWYGLAPIRAVAREANLDINMTEFTRAFFSNAGVPSGLLNIKEKLRDDKRADEIRAKWSYQFQGAQNWHRLAILDEDASYQAMTVEPNKMAMPDLRNLSESRICSVFGVPPSLVYFTLGMASSSYANRVSDRTSFWQDTLIPLYARIAAALTRIVAYEFDTTYNTRIAFNFSNVPALQEDKTAATTRAVQLFEAGVYTRNEARSHVGLPDIGEAGDIFALKSGFTYMTPNGEVWRADDPNPPQLDPNTGIPLPPGAMPMEPDEDEEDEDAKEDDTKEPPKKALRELPRIRVITLAQSDNTGVAVVLPVPVRLAVALALDCDGALAHEDLHLTLAYLGKVTDPGLADYLDNLGLCVWDYADSLTPLDVTVNGVGRFTGDGGKDAIYLAVDSPALLELREGLLDVLAAGGFEPASNHGFTPHITLAYVNHGDESPITSIEPFTFRFTHLDAWIGDLRKSYLLGGGTPPDYDGEREESARRNGRVALTAIGLKAAPSDATMIGGLHRQREAKIVQYAKEFDAYFRWTLNRVDGVIGSLLQDLARSTGERTTLALEPNLTAEMLITPEMDQKLRDLGKTMTLDIAESAYTLVNAWKAYGVTTFDPNSVPVQRIVNATSDRVVGINDVTRQHLRDTINTGLGRGYSIQQIARGVPDDGFTGIRSIVSELYHDRAQTIARTEIGNAQNESAVERYRATAVKAVKVYDGEKHGPCVAVNQTIQTLDWAQGHPLEHPNCVRAFAPILVLPSE